MASRQECDWIYKIPTIFLLLHGLATIVSAGDRPTFIETPPPSKIARQGQSLLLKCRATGRPHPVITWRKDGRLVKDGQDGILLSRGDLAVTSLNTSHRGKYTCLAQSVEGQIRSSTVVRVEAPPEFVKKPSDRTTQEGKDAMFDCSATGYPDDMRYRWTYNGEPVGTSDHLLGRSLVLPDGTLIIYNINTNDRGNVTCTVDNGFGESPTASAALYVQFRARVSNMPAIVYAGLGLRAVLRCPSEAEPPVNNVVWKKLGQGKEDHRRISALQDPRISLDGQGSLIIESASFEDAGTYTCTPYNMHGTLGASTGTDLRIRDPPYFTLKPNRMYEAELGKTISIPCKGDGDPPPAVSWRKVLQNGDSIQYKVEFGNLIIRSVTKAIHGTWQCVLTNSVAEVAVNVQIYVKYTIPHKVMNVTARAMSDTAIQVSWTPGYDGGHSQTFIVWYRQAGKIDPSWQTFDVVGSDTVAVLKNLLQDTAYEVAVLPENKLRSGPFSETVTTRTRVARPLVSTKIPFLSPPQALFSSTTDNGLVQLSWRKPKTYQPNDGNSRGRLDVAPPLSNNQVILGFLVEYRWTGTAGDDSDERLTKRAAPSRSRRATKMPGKNEWVTLTKTYKNITTIVVRPNQLYRDLVYEFRVLTVSEKEYSPPSNPVSFSTKGLDAYPCYTGALRTAAVIDNPVIAGILAAVVLMIILVGFAVYWFCRKRRRKRKKRVITHEEEEENVFNSGRTKPTINGKVIANKQPIVVDLTDGGSGGYATMEKREYDTPCSDEESKIPFIGNNNREDTEKVSTAFMERHHDHLDGDSRKETLSSDRSSVRLRRETAARVLLAQYKRRSLTDHTYHRVHRDIPLRGGTRSASTSPERSNYFPRNDDLNVTAPAVLDGPKGRRRIRLYSRPIDDFGSAQQRRMIVIKRKSQKSSSSEQLKGNSTGAPPSDSSESPVFGVVGRPAVTHPSNNSPEGPVPITSSPIKDHGRSPFRGRQNRHRSPFEDDVFNRHDVISSKDDDFIIRSPDDGRPSWTSPTFPSPSTDHSSPDVSPNRVIARRTVEYDPKVDPIVPPRSYSGSPTRRDKRSNNSNSCLQPVRARSQSHRNFHPNTKYSNLHDSTRSPYDMAPIPRHYQNPGYQIFLHGEATRNRYSLAQNPHGQPIISRQQGHYHPSPPVHNVSRSRASYSFGHHRQPLALFSPNTVYDRPPTRPDLHPSTSGSHSTHPSSSDQRLPQSTCEIDCSNSDIEVRFVKDANGNGYIPVMSRDQVDVVELANVVSPSAQSPSTAGNTATPSSGNSALDLRYNLRNMSTSEAEKYEGPKKITGKPPSPAKRLTPIIKQPQGHRFGSAVPDSNPSKPRPRHLLSPTGSKASSPLRHVKLKSEDGPDAPPMSPPLAAMGSSDYGSQDTSNSSTSPMPSNANSQSTTSPLHLRFPGLVQDRPPRRDNSSVEDNYEWDSEIAMESEILDALRHFGTLKKSGPVSDELLDELNKITKDTKNLPQRQRPQSAEILEYLTSREDKTSQEGENKEQPTSPGPNYSKESMARRCAALRAEFLHYQQLQELDEDGVT